MQLQVEKLNLTISDGLHKYNSLERERESLVAKIEKLNVHLEQLHSAKLESESKLQVTLRIIHIKKIFYY